MSMTWNLGRLLKQGRDNLQAQCKQEGRQAEFLLASLTRFSVTDLYLRSHEPVSPKLACCFLEKIDQIKQGFPLDYLLGEREFYGSFFHVGEGVFLPRQETELIVDEVLQLGLASINGVDFGSGTGCLPISICQKHKQAKFFAIEKQAQALKYLKKNIQSFKLSSQITALNKDVASFCTNSKSINVVTANPPYIDFNDPHISSSVKQFEPHAALFSKEGGLFHIRSWFAKAMEILSPLGWYIFEIGWQQAKEVRSFLDVQTQLTGYKILKDQQGYERVIVCQKKASQ